MVVDIEVGRYKKVHVQRFIAQGNVFNCLALCNKGTTLALMQVTLVKTQ